MKLQISFDITDIAKALEIAHAVEPYVSIIEIGSVLLYKHGVPVIKRFRDEFPHVTLLADAKIIDRSKELVTLFSQAGADWISVMAGTNKNVIHTACTTARALHKKIMLDLLDSGSPGQSALQAKSFGADALLIHRAHTDEEGGFTFLDQWDMVRGNTDLPIFIAGRLTRDTMDQVLTLNPDGIVIGSAVTEADEPVAEIQFIAEKLNPS